MKTNELHPSQRGKRYITIQHLITGARLYLDLHDVETSRLWQVCQRVQPPRWEVIAESDKPTWEKL